MELKRSKQKVCKAALSTPHLRESFQTFHPSPVVKITVRTLGSHGQEGSEWCLVVDTVAVGYRQSLPCCHPRGLSQHQSEPHSLQLSRDPLFPVGPDYPPTSCHSSAKTQHSSVTSAKGSTTSWGLSPGLSKTLMVPGGSYSNNLLSPLSVQLQLCLGPPQLSQQ